MGAASDDAGIFNSGSAYHFRRQSNGAWQFQTQLNPSPSAAYDQFGSSVAIGESFLAGSAIGDNTSGGSAGAATVFYDGPNPAPSGAFDFASGLMQMQNVAVPGTGNF